MEWITPLAILGFSLVFLHYFALWLERRGWMYYRTKPKAGGGVGSALQEMNKLMNPSVQHVQEQQKRTRRQANGNEGEF